jgi:hypothetical protein
VNEYEYVVQSFSGILDLSNKNCISKINLKRPDLQVYKEDFRDLNKPLKTHANFLEELSNLNSSKQLKKIQAHWNNDI